jgi:sulfofructose kinase
VYDVICVGDVAVDEYYRVPRLPGADEKVYARRLGKVLGGTTCNTARALHNLGANILFITQVGDDPAGDFTSQKFDEIGLPHHLLIAAGMDTFSTVIISAEGGEKSILLLASQNCDQAVNLYPQAPLHAARVVYSTGGESVLPYLENYTVPIVLSLEEPTIQKYPAIISWASEHVHTLILDRNSFRTIFNQDIFEIGVTKLQFGSPALKNLIVTLGQRGAVAVSWPGNRVVESNAYAVEIADTTAAGDIFNAAFISSFYLRQLSIQTALQYANAVAAASCEELGTELSVRAIQKAQQLFQIEKGGEDHPVLPV